MDSIVGNIFKFLGVTGAGLDSSIAPRGGNVYNKMLNDSFNASSEIGNPDKWGQFNSIMRRPVNYEEALRLWDEMSSWDLVAAALQLVTDETLQTDTMSPGTIWYECNNLTIEDSLNNMLIDIGVEDVLPSQVWHTASFGNSFEKLTYSPGEGVTGFMYAHPMDVRRYWLQKNRRAIGYKWFGNKPKKDDDKNIDGSELSRSALNNGKEVEELWYPWDFMHIRRIYRQRSNEHGEPLFEDAQGIYKKLRMALDQMAICRANIQPDRYVMNIDVKDQVPIDQIKTVQRWRSQFRSKMAQTTSNGSTFGAGSDFKAFYDPMALDTILWMAKPNGFQHSVEKIPGTSNVPDVYDIELMTNLFFSVLGMPKSWLGFASAQGSDQGPVSGKAILAQDMKFQRKIKSIRRPIIHAYEWLAYFHVILKHPNFDLSELQINCKMPPITVLEDQLKLEMLEKQADVLDKLAGVMERFSLPRSLWIEIVFKKYMSLPDDIVDVFMTELPPESAPAQENLTRKNPSIKRIMEDVVATLGKDKSNIQANLFSLMDGRIPKKRKYIYRTKQDVMKKHCMAEGDVVVSGYGQLELNEHVSSESHKVSSSGKVNVDMGANTPAPGTDRKKVRALTESHRKANKHGNR